uniref:oligopeptidase A n=1 Tax=Phlebotomus kandelakii TaxID=1109342 RepID=A0A6B2EC97_9DIPT
MAVSLCGKRALLTRANYNVCPKRFGYIVLVPEIGEDLPEKNPLQREDGLPEFGTVTVEKCVSVIGKQAVDVEKQVKELDGKLALQEDVKDVFSEVVDPLEHIGAPLETTWGLAKTLYLGNSVLMPTKSYITIHERARRARMAKFSSVNIFRAIKEAHLGGSESLSEEQKRIIQKYLLEGKLNGLELQGEQKARLDSVLSKLGSERAKFRQKVEISTKQFNHVIEDYNLMRDFPPEVLQMFSKDATQPTKGPWLVTLQPHVAANFLEYCPDRTMRWNLWQAQTRRNSNFSEKALETSTHIEEIRFLRRDQAKLLGYDSFVDMSMETKMAGNRENVTRMLEALREKAKPAQDMELKSLRDFAGQFGFKGKLEAQDIPYYRRKQLKTLHHYDEEIIREYFPLPKVLTGMFELCEKMFHIQIIERPGVDTWHEDVRYFEVLDDEKTVAGFYLDLYTREDVKMQMKDNFGWTVGIRNRSSVTNTKPLSALIFNFPAPIYGKPSLLSFDDVVMLFQRFGYALQHLLTRVNYSEVAGVSNIEWDAVEVGSHVMAHFLYNSGTLKDISSHYATEDALSDALVGSIQASRTHLAGYDLCQQLYFAALDMELHSRKDFWVDIMRELWPRYITLPLEKKDAHPCSFTPIFSGDWAAAYFSHVWSQVIAADVYSAFHEASSNPEALSTVGRRFRDTFLAMGGACAPAEVFRRFRGRDPSPKALISVLGLKRKAKVGEDSGKK